MKKTILVGEFKHETNSFMPEKSGVEAFMARDYFFGEEIFKVFQGVRNELGGILDYFCPIENCRLVPVMAFNAQPGGIVTREVFQSARDALLEAIEKQERVDGILLALHGAMVAEGYPDGEGALLETLRDKVGTEVPIIASLDLHCNLTKKMVKYADAFFPYDYYPHTDTYEAGIRAAKCMWDTLEGRIHPVMAYGLWIFCSPICLPPNHVWQSTWRKHRRSAVNLRMRFGRIERICGETFGPLTRPLTMRRKKEKLR